ncbi:manganese efflux pump MntP [Cellulosilyticum sp. WCF-2]|uniref:manganese efflux pump MntP n=1 Tax=Cellulosilyticum sp. WCF-2 TaxID=2497860 RepID=UPI000F8DB695|nr:manganese efflux pump MntP family protein [Cellulosilyticum sp. WCF-2]QEH67852.1 manganese efflux pump [Cellulosilyticum sp. WCF-2]
MNLLELFILAVGLSMDAFAVAISKGLSMKKMSFKNAIIIGLYFGIFQAVMPLIGYCLGTRFEDKITAFDHWIAFFLLGFIGINMIREALSKEDDEAEEDVSLSFKTMSVLAIATSIDALAVGVTFAFLNVNIIPAVSFIGIVTFALSILGVKIGNVFGSKYKSKAELAGGLILIGMGLKILLSHL